MFGEPEDSLLSLDEEEHHDFQRVSNVENSILTAPFLEKEVKEAIFQMEHNKARGPDGFPAEFYQRFWEIIKHDLMQIFNDLYLGETPLRTLYNNIGRSVFLM